MEIPERFSESWEITLFTNFAGAVTDNLRALLVDGISLSEAAWRARSLLELYIWIEYCCRSRENAKRFWDDAGRDMNELLKSYLTATRYVPHMAYSASRISELERSREILLESAANMQIDIEEESYKRVSKAAEELDRKVFPLLNKILSKFAHPTAAAIVAWKGTEEPWFTGFRDAVRNQGLSFAIDAFKMLKQLCERQGGRLAAAIESALTDNRPAFGPM